MKRNTLASITELYRSSPYKVSKRVKNILILRYLLCAGITLKNTNTVNLGQHGTYLCQMRVNQVIDEIKSKMKQPPYRAASDVFHLLSNNRQLFTGKIDKDDLAVLLKDLETLSESHPTSYHTEMYRRDTEHVMNRLNFYLDRIL